MEFFVSQKSIVRKIWGKGDTILFIFAGASAEFALNKAVDWLYFTGRLPADPLGRLFSTVMYARRIVFSPAARAMEAIDQITSIHTAIEKSRGAKIPDWAYRDVLFMLIHYSISAFEVLERKLDEPEKEEVYDVFKRMGDRMHLVGLPRDFHEWTIMREAHLQNDLEKSHYTIDLYHQYRKHLGPFRYFILKESQKLVVPGHVRRLLDFSRFSWVSFLIYIYKVSRRVGLDNFIRSLVMPREYKEQIRDLDVIHAGHS